MIVTSLTLLSKSLSSCDSHLHTNTDLLASWKFFWCVCVCVCGRARPFIVRGLTNPGTWFSHSTQPKQSGPWQRAAVKIQLLKETKGGRSKENQLSTPPTRPASGRQWSPFNLRTITLLPSFPNQRLKHNPNWFSGSVLFWFSVHTHSPLLPREPGLFHFIHIAAAVRGTTNCFKR